MSDVGDGPFYTVTLLVPVAKVEAVYTMFGDLLADPPPAADPPATPDDVLAHIDAAPELTANGHTRQRKPWSQEARDRQAERMKDKAAARRT
jgi:hypothetical protein